MTIPESACRSAGLEIGDRLAVETAADGKVLLTRIDGSGPEQPPLSQPGTNGAG